MLQNKPYSRICVVICDTIVCGILGWLNFRCTVVEFVNGGTEYMFMYGWPQMAYQAFSVVPAGKPGGLNYYALVFDILFASGVVFGCHWLFKKVCRTSEPDQRVLTSDRKERQAPQNNAENGVE